MRLCALCALCGSFFFLVASCSAPTTPDAGQPAPEDAGRLTHDAAPDAALPAPDATVADAGAPDAAPPTAGFVAARTTDGSTVAGELIATYDARRWWTPADEDRYALFSDTVRVLSSRDLVALDPAPSTTALYRNQLRDARIGLHQSPFARRSYVITAHERYHLDEDGFGDFAWDLVMTDDEGRRFTDLGARNPDFLVWDQPVRLPTGGTVVEVVRDAPDNAPGSYPEGAVNNLVGVRLDGGFHLYLLHFRQGSIPPEVRVGAVLPAGAPLGRVGNSGVSLEPHLHVVLLYWVAAEGRFYSVPMEFFDVWATPDLAEPPVRRPFWDPPSEVWLGSEPW